MAIANAIYHLSFVQSVVDGLQPSQTFDEANNTSPSWSSVSSFFILSH